MLQGKGSYFLTEPALQSCDYSLKNEDKCLKTTVICISQDFEPRNQTTQKSSTKDKEEQSEPFNYIASHRCRSFCKEEKAKALPTDS